MAEPGRVDAELVRRGLARSRREAVALVEAGLVHRQGQVVRRAADRVDGDEDLAVDRPASDDAYASRAAHKLEGALRALDRAFPAPDHPAPDNPAAAPAGPLAVPVEGASCLDLGASTGGFTDVLLRRGARRVVALDVGHDQIVDRLRKDPRVDVREGANARDLVPADLPGPVDVVVGDLSFISLGHVLPAVARVVGPDAAVLLLVKPQFEVGRERLGTGGVVRDPEHMVDAVVGVARSALAVGLRAVAVVPSPLPGPHGNREFLLRLLPSSGSGPGKADAAVAAAEVAAAARAAVATPVAPPDDAWSPPPVPEVFVVGARQRTTSVPGPVSTPAPSTVLKEAP
ncbi:TlyA family RNA methyltransferase [Luteimicrobium subarcticum]|uniref:23S rRNA (Cytidine1920-2'-O)/16S rRNA (Cytidine1409-2'-O)-methyltransferase n=1 Tax=Luteimicrobium subarcticum TaxID=620910 RepID=A0A2M8WWJ6_9MICO|nr:TlyA family RNA methyltransferase [Luteimicrobium subarcticum]PJI95293.1 23S rRNA (cytidine1920-2'-O)/16S rRNA (cytidine1409-2'-O)-methyltransferase [Luteimicrobium subarcticum]